MAFLDAAMDFKVTDDDMVGLLAILCPEAVLGCSIVEPYVSRNFSRSIVSRPSWIMVRFPIFLHAMR